MAIRYTPEEKTKAIREARETVDAMKLPQMTAHAQVALLTGVFAGILERESAPKQQITIRLDADVVDALKSTGKGWQTRLNSILRKALAL